MSDRKLTPLMCLALMFALMFGTANVVCAAEKDGAQAAPEVPMPRPGQTPPASTSPAARKGCNLQASKGCCETNGFRWDCAWASGPADDDGKSKMVYKCACI